MGQGKAAGGTKGIHPGHFTGAGIRTGPRDSPPPRRPPPSVGRTGSAPPSGVARSSGETNNGRNARARSRVPAVGQPGQASTRLRGAWYRDSALTERMSVPAGAGSGPAPCQRRSAQGSRPAGNASVQVRRTGPRYDAGSANTDLSGGHEQRSADADLANRRIVREVIVVAHIGVLTNTQDRLLCCDLIRQELLYASTDDERPFVLHVQPCQYAKVGVSPVQHNPHCGDTGRVVDVRIRPKQRDWRKRCRSCGAARSSHGRLGSGELHGPVNGYRRKRSSQRMATTPTWTLL